MALRYLVSQQAYPCAKNFYSFSKFDLQNRITGVIYVCRLRV
jgi:hypothetical protein